MIELQASLPEKECPVCLDEYYVLGLFPQCKHEICLYCARKLLAVGQSPHRCPLCRGDLGPKKTAFAFTKAENCTAAMANCEEHLVDVAREYARPSIGKPTWPSMQVTILRTIPLPNYRVLQFQRRMANALKMGPDTFSTAYDLNQPDLAFVPWRMRTRSPWKGAQLHPLFDDVHDRARRIITDARAIRPYLRHCRVVQASGALGPETPVEMDNTGLRRYIGLDLHRTTLLTTDGYRLTGLQYLMNHLVNVVTASDRERELALCELFERSPTTGRSLLLAIYSVNRGLAQGATDLVEFEAQLCALKTTVKVGYLFAWCGIHDKACKRRAWTALQSPEAQVLAPALSLSFRVTVSDS